VYITYAGRLLLRKLPLIIVTALVGLGLAAAAFFTMLSYSSSAFMVILPSSSMASMRAVSPERFFQTETQLMLSDTVLGHACESLNDGTTPQILRKVVTLSGGSQSDIVELIVSGKTPKQSLNRRTAVLKGLAGTTLQGIQATTLWTEDPQSTMSGLQILAGGLLGGAFFGALVTLIWGAVARPILDPRWMALDGLDMDVYPQIVVVGGPQWPLQNREMLSWLSRHGSPGKPKCMLVADLTKTAGSQAFLRALQDAPINTSAITFMDANDYVSDADQLSAASDAERVVLYVGTVNKTREAEVEDRARMLRGVANQSVFVLTRRSKGNSLPSQHGTARRGMVSTR
jgi:hypothetical protein